MKINGVILIFIALFIFACGKEDATIKSSDQILEEEFQDLEADSRIGLCDFDYTINSNGCCVYSLPFGPDLYYIVDGVEIQGGSITVCEGESVFVVSYERVPENKSGLRVICQQMLTCSCCDQFDWDLTFQQVQADCCRITLRFDRPQCVADIVATALRPEKLGNGFTWEKIRETQQDHIVEICGSGEYSDEAKLLVQFKIDNQCKSDPILLPLDSCF